MSEYPKGLLRSVRPSLQACSLHFDDGIFFSGSAALLPDAMLAKIARIAKSKTQEPEHPIALVSITENEILISYHYANQPIGEPVSFEAYKFEAESEERSIEK